MVSWHHVIQRGAGKRPIFPSAADERALEQLLRASVRRGPFEVHAFTVLTTHCHLLVRCPRQALSEALREIFGPFAKRMNRRLGREGPLYGGRSRVLPVSSAAHWRATVAYIDRNAVEAGLTRRPATYPFCSAWHYARLSGPPWLRRDVVEAFVRRHAGGSTYVPSDYAAAFGATSRSVIEFAERRLSAPVPELDPLDDLLAAAPGDVRRWLERRALLADGLSAGPVLVAPSALLGALAAERLRLGCWTPGSFPTGRPGPKVDGWRVLAVGLLRVSAGLGLAEIGLELGLSPAGVHVNVRRHSMLLHDDSVYAVRAERVLSLALGRTFAPERRTAPDDH